MSLLFARCFSLLVFLVFLFTVGEQYLFPGVDEYFSVTGEKGMGGSG